MKKIAILALTASLAFAHSALASTSASVDGGTLNFNNVSGSTPSSIAEGTNVTDSGSDLSGFGSNALINIDEADQVLAAITAQETIRLDDNRGNLAGWKVSVSANSTVTATVADPLSSAQGTLSIAVPTADVLTFTANSLTSLAGATNNVALTSSGTLSATGQSLLRAIQGYGDGAYSAVVTYSLAMPSYYTSGTTITPSDATTSTFDERLALSAAAGGTVENVGLLAGTYTATVNYAISATP